jgi:hypothetical protein
MTDWSVQENEGERLMARMNIVLTAGVAVAAAIVGVVVAVGLGIGGFGNDLLGNTESTITLRLDAAQKCAVAGKETEVSVKKGKQVTWRVRNYCPGDQTVLLGNFYKANGVSVPDCGLGSDWPFDDNDKEKRSAKVPEGQKRDIKLKDAKTGDSQALYTFDICLGGVKMEPRLIIDP